MTRMYSSATAYLLARQTMLAKRRVGGIFKWVGKGQKTVHHAPAAQSVRDSAPQTLDTQLLYSTPASPGSNDRA